MTQEKTISPTILAIDSSTGICSISILKNNDIIVYLEEKTISLQAKRLIPMVEDALRSSNIGYRDISSIACSVGPGGFTGIRIGLAAARAIGFAANIPVLGFSTLEVIALEKIENDEGANIPIYSSLNAGKGEIIYQYFDRDLEAKCPPTIAISHPAAEKDIIITYPRADFLAKLALKYPQKATKAAPFYVRPPDAKLPETK